jgi:hypothetical protein
VNICQNENSRLVRMRMIDPDKALKTLERVKGIEPSYSAWKAAALPLSYTRARGINYHAVRAASTAMPPRSPVPGPAWAAGASPLNTGHFHAYTQVSINTTKGGDPVSFTKRCHLAGIARQAV